MTYESFLYQFNHIIELPTSMIISWIEEVRGKNCKIDSHCDAIQEHFIEIEQNKELQERTESRLCKLSWTIQFDNLNS